MSYSPNQRTTIDQEVFKWVSQQREKDKIVTVNAIRQKAFELGQEFDPNFKASLNWYNNWKKRYDYTESPEAEALKHKKRHYTAAFKLHAVQRAAEMESASQAALELDVSRRCLQRWTEELDLITSVVEHSSNAVYRRPGQGRKVVDSNLDNSLLEWVKESWKQGINVTSGMIREKAREMSRAPNFKASLGWYMKWQKRHGIDLKEQTCNPSAGDTVSPLKLRLLQEGEVYTYSPTQPSAKRRKITKKKLSYDDEALLENDEEFDRQLLTWLVERWEAGDIVSDRMVKDKAMEITSNPDFKVSKAWLSAWKRKYNISLENQTYGNEGEDEPEEIIEESEVYDNEVLLEEQQQTGVHVQQQQQAPQQGETSGENPLTPTKEEAATALASLSAEDHEAAGLEIAEALQKLANAFGITGQSGDDAKEAMAQLTAAYQADNPEFLLEGAGQVAVEEVVSEEVVTDEPMVVIETAPEVTTTVNHQTNDTPIVSYSVATTTETVSTHLTTTVAQSEEVRTLDAVPAEQIPTTTITEIISTSTISQTPVNNVVVTTSPLASYISEEIVVVDPELAAAEGDDQVEVLVQGDNNGLVLIETTPHEEVIVQQTCGDDEIRVSVAPPISSSSEVEVVSEIANETSVVTEIVTTNITADHTHLTSDPSTLATENVSIETVSAPQELLDIVQESITGGVVLPTAGGEGTIEVISDHSYDEEFKRKVISRVAETGSVEEIAKEFSVPWVAVMNWMAETSSQREATGKESNAN